MSATPPGIPSPHPPRTLVERLELANRLFREYHTRCFWHCPPELVITEELIPLVIHGLRKHGGRTGFILSGQLREDRTPTSAIEGPECP